MISRPFDPESIIDLQKQGKQGHCTIMGKAGTVVEAITLKIVSSPYINFSPTG